MKDLKEAGVAHPTGNPVIPLVDKKPLVTKWQLKTREALLASSMWPSANNYGIRLDDLTVIDVDDGDPDDALKYLGIDTEPTGRVRTNRGYHLFFKGKTETSKFEGNGTKGDILSGNTRFVVGWEYPDGDIQELPSEWSPPRRAKTAGAGWEYPLLKDVPEGRRHKRFLSASHKLTAAGLTEGTVLAALRSENKLMAKPLPDKQIADTARDGFAFESARLAHPAQMAIYSPEELKLEGRKAKMGRFQRRSLGKAAPPPTSVDCNDRPLTFAEEAQSHYGHPKTGKTWSALGLCNQAVGRALYVSFEKMAGVTRHIDLLPNRDQVYHVTHHEWVQVLKEDPGMRTEFGFTVVVIDSVSSMGAKTDGTNFEEVYSVLEPLYTSPSSTLILIDHLPRSTTPDRNPGPIGSNIKTARTDAQYLCIQDGDSAPARGILKATLTETASNYLHTPDGYHLAVNASIPEVRALTDPEERVPPVRPTPEYVYQKYLDKADGWGTQAKCATVLGMPPSTFRDRYNAWKGGR